MKKEILIPDKNKYPLAYAFSQLGKLIIEEWEDAINRKELRVANKMSDYYMTKVILEKNGIIENPFYVDNENSSISKYILK